MFCNNCGRKMEDNEIFCSNCGKKRNMQQMNIPPQNVQLRNVQSGYVQQRITNSTYSKVKNEIAFYISLITSPLLFLFCVLNLEEEYVRAGEGGAWKSGYPSYLPDEMKMAVIIITWIFTILNIVLRIGNKQKGSKNTVTTIMLFVNLIVGYFLAFVD